MRYVKTAFLIALLTLISALPRPAYASAESKLYAYSETGETYFCAEKNTETALFAIPETYCAEITGEDGDWYCVTYARDEGVYRALHGYVLKNSVLVSEIPPQNTYLNTTITIVYRTDTVVGSLPALGDIEITAAYYGGYTIGQTAYSYVLCGNDFGYVSKTVDGFPLNELPKPVEPKPAETDDTTARLITACAVTVVASVAIIIIFITGKNKVPKPNNASSYNKQ